MLSENLIANAIEASPLSETFTLNQWFQNLAMKHGVPESFNRKPIMRFRVRTVEFPFPEKKLERYSIHFFTTKDYGNRSRLTLSKKIVEDHGGSISVTSDEQEQFFLC